jgi:YfiH family protein
MPIEIITTDERELQSAGFLWRERNGVRALVCAPLREAGFANGFSTRLGGTSPMPEGALNLAGFNDDTAENIYENRRRFLQLFDGEWSLAAGWQVHGADVRVVLDESDARGPDGARGETEHCDALVTNASGVLVGVKTADCVPVILGDTRTRAVAAIHAGWRGTLARIVAKTIERMRKQYGTKASDVRAAIGPAARACCYEVGAEVIEAFEQGFPDAGELLTQTRAGHALIDLQRANRRQLLAAGVSQERIHVAPLCTMCRTDLFFSYRREKNLRGRVGRLMSVIGKDEGGRMKDE